MTSAAAALREKVGEKARELRVENPDYGLLEVKRMAIGHWRNKLVQELDEAVYGLYESENNPYLSTQERMPATTRVVVATAKLTLFNSIY